MKLSSILWFVIGSLFIAISSGVGLVAAFGHNILIVYLSIAGHIFGYKIVQVGLHEDSILSFSFIKNKKLDIVNVIYILIGGGLMGYSFILLTEGIASSIFLFTLLAAIVMGAGYVFAHWGINKALV